MDDKAETENKVLSTSTISFQENNRLGPPFQGVSPLRLGISVSIHNE